MPITREEIESLSVPFVVVSDHSGNNAMVEGFSKNDPLGVGGGILPDNPTVYFKSGGWLLFADFMQHFSLPVKTAE